ncbi:gpt, partial [Symbiodinium pilosum]
MEIHVDAADGFAVPKDTFVSIRIGDVQKQSRFGPAKTFRFPQQEDNSGLARIEVFHRVGHLTFGLNKLSPNNEKENMEIPVEMPGVSSLPIKLGLQSK